MSFTGSALSWHRQEDVLEVALHRDPCNEIGTVALDELERLVDVLHQGAEGARALLIHSDRRGFCAGADLRELHAALEDRASRLGRWTDRLPTAARRGAARLGRVRLHRRMRRFVDRIHAVFDALDSAPLVTVAALHGVCFGGGLELALTCDIRVADRSARFSFPELRLGLIPGFGGIPRLRREVGGGVILDLLLTGRSLGARRAHEVGLVSHLVGRGQAREAGRRVAAQAARFDPHTVAAAKAFAKPLPREALAREKALFCRLLTRPQVREALTRFVMSENLRPYLP